jgi:hypothetical protein
MVANDSAAKAALGWLFRTRGHPVGTLPLLDWAESSVEVRGFEPLASSVREKKRPLRYLRVSEKSLVV